MTTKQTATITNWTLLRDKSGAFYLRGHVTDHPRQAEFKSELQDTSRVVLFDTDNNIAETLNTAYTLAQPAEAPATAVVD